MAGRRSEAAAQEAAAAPADTPPDPSARRNIPPPWTADRLTLDELLGPLPLTWGEDADAFVGLQGRLTYWLPPVHAMEEGLGRDFVAWSAHVDRLQRWQGALRPDFRIRGLSAALTGVVDERRLAALVAGCRRGDPEVIAEAEEALARVGTTFDQAAALAVASCPDYAQLTRLARDAGRQMDKAWRRIDESRTTRDRAQRAVMEHDRRQAAAAKRIRQAELKGLRDPSRRGVAPPPTAEAASPPDEPPPASEPPPEPPPIGVVAGSERPPWIDEVVELKDRLPPLAPAADGQDWDYLYYIYALSVLPGDTLAERCVRTAVQARMQQEQLTRDIVDVVGAGLSTELLETLRTLAPDADHGALMAGYRVDPAAQEEVEAILSAAGLTMAQLEARGVLRNIKEISALQRRLIDMQEQTVAADKTLEERRAKVKRRPLFWRGLERRWADVYRDPP